MTKQQDNHRMHMTFELNPFGDAATHVQFWLMKIIIISTIISERKENVNCS